MVATAAFSLPSSPSGRTTVTTSKGSLSLSLQNIFMPLLSSSPWHKRIKEISFRNALIPPQSKNDSVVCRPVPLRGEPESISLSLRESPMPQGRISDNYDGDVITIKTLTKWGAFNQVQRLPKWNFDVSRLETPSHQENIKMLKSEFADLPLQSMFLTRFSVPLARKSSACGNVTWAGREQ